MYIFGNTEFSKKVKEMIDEDTPGLFQGYVKNKDFMDDIDALSGVIAYEDLVQSNECHNLEIVVTIGYTRMNSVREHTISSLKKDGVHVITYVHKSVIIPKSVKLGIGCVALEGCIFEPNINVGEGCIFDSGAVVAHDTNIGSFNWFGMGSVTLGKVSIGNNCFIGANSTIRDNIIIGDAALIGAGAFVNNNLNDKAVIVPARSVVLDKTSDQIRI